MSWEPKLVSRWEAMKEVDLGGVEEGSVRREGRRRSERISEFLERVLR